MMFLALVLAFASFPGANELRPAERRRPTDRAFFTARIERVVPQDRLEFNAAETAMPVFDKTQERLYLSTRDGVIRCWRREQTDWLWQARGGILAAPLLDDQTLYVAAGDGTLSALNRINGEVRWQSAIKEELTTTPTLFEGKLFVMSSEDSLTALDAATGKSLWKFHRERPAGFTIRGNARPVVAHGIVYAAYSDGTVAALNPADGAARWVRNVSGTGDYLDVDQIAAPEDDNRIYAASAKEGVLALDARTGDLVWTAALPGANHVSVDGRRVYATGKAAIVGLSRRDGRPLWTTKLAHDTYATEPVAIDGLVLVSEDRGALLALEATTGRPRSALNPGTGFSMPAVVMPGAAFIISNEGNFFALGLLP